MCSSITAEVRFTLTRHDDGHVDWYATCSEPDGPWEFFDEGGPSSAGAAAGELQGALASWIAKEFGDAVQLTIYAG